LPGLLQQRTVANAVVFSGRNPDTPTGYCHLPFSNSQQ
jgi:hypothetical protein